MPDNADLVRKLAEHGFKDVTGQCDRGSRQTIRVETDPTKFGRYNIFRRGGVARIGVIDYDGRTHVAKGDTMPDDLKKLVQQGSIYVPDPMVTLQLVRQ